MTTAADSNRPRETRSPAVSVIIPAYNVARYIGEALNSVFVQTFTDYDVIVVNDGSPDTTELEQALKPYRDRIRYVKQENRGPGGARNTGILASNAPYVAMLDGDDVWTPNHLRALLDVFRTDPELELVYGDVLYFGLSPNAGRTFMQLFPSHGTPTFEHLLTEQCSIPTSCVVARRQALIDAGMFDEQFWHSEDFDLWVRLAHRGGRIGYLRQVLAGHRAHGGNLTADLVRLYEGYINVCRNLADTLPLSTDAKRLIEQQIVACRRDLVLIKAKTALLAGDFPSARQVLDEAGDVHPNLYLRMMRLMVRSAPGALRMAYQINRRVAAVLNGLRLMGTRSRRKNARDAKALAHAMPFGEVRCTQSLKPPL